MAQAMPCGQNSGSIDMKTRISSIVLMVVCTLLISYAQIMYKIGAATLQANIIEVLCNTHIMLGLTMYFIGAMIMIVALKSGELSILYPFLALSYIWVSILSTRFLPTPEHMNILKWIGVFIIILGVTCIGIGSTSKQKPEEGAKP